MNMDTCREWLERCHDYMHKDLGEPVRVDFERHMGVCPPCGSFLTTYERTVSLTQKLRLDEIPSDVRDSLRRFLHERCTDAV